MATGRATVLGSERDGAKFGQAGEERSIFVSKRRYDSVTPLQVIRTTNIVFDFPIDQES
jgi:hypothetical protein